jgi:hypothetical protein
MPMDPADPWVLPLLSAMRRRPGMWIGDQRACTLNNFLHAYAWGRQDLGLRDLQGEQLLADFWTFARERRGVDYHSGGWVHDIESLDPSDTNVRTFFTLFEEFLQTIGLTLFDDARIERYFAATAEKKR